jgi:hypothetical protein
VRTLDANTAVFEEGLRYVFAKNVAKARRDNKHVVGATDIAPPKALTVQSSGSLPDLMGRERAPHTKTRISNPSRVQCGSSIATY